jgi:hypothetical protein
MDGERTEVSLAAPNDDQLEKRELFADQVLKVHYGWDDEQCESFLRGGPLLIYYANRELLTELPTLWIRQFIEDIEVNSPQEAHEFARDLLKEANPDMQELTIENLKRDLENL